MFDFTKLFGGRNRKGKVHSPTLTKEERRDFERDVVVAQFAIKLHFGALGAGLRDMVAGASAREGLFDEEIDAITIKLWLALRNATRQTLEKVVAEKNANLEVPPVIQELCKKSGRPLE